MKSLEKINNLKPRRLEVLDKLLVLRASLLTDEKYQEAEAKVLGGILGVLTFFASVIVFKVTIRIFYHIFKNA